MHSIVGTPHPPGKLSIEVGRPLRPTPNLIPVELRDRPSWVAWKSVPKPGRSKPSKVPFNPTTGQPADPTDPKTWGRFDDALALARDRHFSGFGYVFSRDDPFAGVDVDGCRNPATGQLDPWAEEIVAALDTYTEVSPSGTGVKAFLQGRLPGRRCRRGKVELYDRDRFFAVTGLKLEIAPANVRPGQAALDGLYRELFDPDLRQPPRTAPAALVALPDDIEVVQRACAARNGAKFARLWAGDWSGYATHSEADLALCGLLAFWVGGDPERIDRLFRSSGLMRPKWNERHFGDGRTYGQATVERAVASCRATYGAADLSRPPGISPVPPKTQLY
jgi:primase-polymerase (primpol)-like protein